MTAVSPNSNDQRALVALDLGRPLPPPSPYPSDIFERRRKYGVPVWMSRHPELNTYIYQVNSFTLSYVRQCYVGAEQGARGRKARAAEQQEHDRVPHRQRYKASDGRCGKQVRGTAVGVCPPAPTTMTHALGFLEKYCSDKRVKQAPVIM